MIRIIIVIIIIIVIVKLALFFNEKKPSRMGDKDLIPFKWK